MMISVKMFCAWLILYGKSYGTYSVKQTGKAVLKLIDSFSLRLVKRQTRQFLYSKHYWHTFCLSQLG